MKYNQYFTDDGVLLAYFGEPKEVPILTISFSHKWYNMYLVNPDGSVSVAEPSDDKRLNTWHSSHVPIPGRVEQYADHMGYELCDNAFDLIMGRWMLRSKECGFDVMVKEAIELLSHRPTVALIERMMAVPIQMGASERTCKAFDQFWCREIAAQLRHLSDDEIVDEVRQMVDNDITRQNSN
jgi:hypothetical protein